MLLVGGGGHSKSVIDVLLQIGDFYDLAMVDVRNKVGTEVLGIPVIGCDDDLHELFHSGYTQAFVTMGSIGDAKRRAQLFHQLIAIGFEIPTIVARSSVVSSHAELYAGVFVGANAVINAGSVIQIGAIINTAAVVEHDCVVGDFSHIAPGSVLCGGVHVGNNTHIGANAVVNQQLQIGSNTMIGAGSVVTKAVMDNVVAYGNPCEVKKKCMF